jgi:hypothetical protein
VFSLLKPAEVEVAFQRWVSAALEKLTGRQVVLDGKTLRGSQDGEAKAAVHLVSAWVHEHGLVLGQREVDRKSNEITALPQLLQLLDLQGAIVSIDAMGCQTALAEQIIEAQGDYVLAVKASQPQMLDDVRLWLEQPPTSVIGKVKYLGCRRRSNGMD